MLCKWTIKSNNPSVRRELGAIEIRGWCFKRAAITMVPQSIRDGLEMMIEKFNDEDMEGQNYHIDISGEVLNDGTTNVTGILKCPEDKMDDMIESFAMALEVNCIVELDDDDD